MEIVIALSFIACGLISFVGCFYGAFVAARSDKGDPAVWIIGGAILAFIFIALAGAAAGLEFQ